MFCGVRARQEGASTGLMLGHLISDPWSLRCLLSTLPAQAGSAPGTLPGQLLGGQAVRVAVRWPGREQTQRNGWCGAGGWSRLGVSGISEGRREQDRGEGWVRAAGRAQARRGWAAARRRVRAGRFPSAAGSP